MISKKQRIVSAHILLEFILLNLSIGLVFYFKNYFTISAPPNEKFTLANFMQLIIVFNLIWGLIVILNGDQRLYMVSKLRKRTKYLILNTFLFIGITSTIAILFKIEYFNRTSFLLPIFVFSIFNLFLFSLLYEYYQRKKHRFSYSTALLIVGAKNKKEQFSKCLDKIKQRGYNIIGMLGEKDNQAVPQGIPVLGNMKELAHVLATKDIDEIFVTAASMKRKKVKNIIKTADYQGIRVNIITQTPFYSNQEDSASDNRGLPIIPHRITPLDNFNNYILKRIFDICFSLTVIILLLPFFLLIALLISLDGKGPVLYTPVRKGEGGRTFRCYKFRTMSICDNPVNGTKSTVKNDPRITLIGKYLRKYDMDELPQFFNVLKGDMSVVGPRPHRSFLQDDFRKTVNEYMVRHYVKPGITGWAQVNGWRGPTQTQRQKQERIKHDLWFIENWSFFLDLKIIFLTVFGKETRRNAF